MATTVVFTGTPEAFAAQQREIKEKERLAKQQVAAKAAKARAARYNLTLRAKDLKKYKDAMLSESEIAEKEEDQKKQAASNRRSLIKSLSKRLSRASQRLSSRSKRASTRKSLAAPAKSRPVEEEEEDEEEEAEEEVVLWMGELARALEQQEAYTINKAILTAFLGELAPERLGEVDDLLEEYQGREEKLFEELAEKYPVPESSQKTLGEETFKALGEAIPDSADDEEDGGYILSLMSDNYGKWAANVQSHILKQRMLQAGASQEDVDAIMNNHSEMI